MDKDDDVCVCVVEYYWSIKRNEILPFAATQMNLEIIVLTEVSQSQILYDTTYMYYL